MATGRTIVSWRLTGVVHAGEILVVAVNYAAEQSQYRIPLPFADRVGSRWQLQEQLSEASYEWNGDDLHGKGLFLDLAPWQACVFLLRRLA